MALLNLEQTNQTNALAIKNKLIALAIGRDIVPANIFYDGSGRECIAWNTNDFGMLRSISLLTQEVIDGDDGNNVRSWTAYELAQFIPFQFNGFVSITYTPLILSWKCTLVTTGGTYNKTVGNKSNALAEALLAALNDAGSGLTPK